METYIQSYTYVHLLQIHLLNIELRVCILITITLHVGDVKEGMSDPT